MELINRELKLAILDSENTVKERIAKARETWALEFTRIESGQLTAEELEDPANARAVVARLLTKVDVLQTFEGSYVKLDCQVCGNAIDADERSWMWALSNGPIRAHLACFTQTYSKGWKADAAAVAAFDDDYLRLFLEDGRDEGD